MGLSDILAGSERGIIIANGIILPKDEQIKDFNKCIWTYNVLADTNSADDYKNDYNGFFFQKQTSSDLCDFVLVENDLTEHVISDQTYGEYKDFGDIDSNSEYKHFILSWKKVIDTLGIGCYTVRKDKTIANVAVVETSLTYELAQFSSDRANNTYRLDCIQDGELLLYKTDFKGTGFRDSLRLIGYFGLTEPETTEESMVYGNNKDTQSTKRRRGNYIVNDTFLPIEPYNRLKDVILMSNDIYGNDYNTDNASYDLVKIPIKETGFKPTPRRGSRNIVLEMEFEDRFINNRKSNC